MSRGRLPEFVIETRRTSASSSAETSTSNVVVSEPSRRVNSARSSSKATAIVVRLDAARLESRRPRHAAAHVLDVDVGAEVVAGRVLAPARQRQIAPAAVSRAGRGEHGGVAAVREQMRGGRRLMRGDEPPSAGRFDVAGAGGRLHFRRPKARRRDVARHALLQQQFGRLDDRLGMEARPHRAVEQSVGDGDDRHALMMRHEGAHDRDAFALGHARRRVIQRLVEAVAPLRADLGQPRQIGHRRARIDHRRQRGGVGRDDPLFAEAALQPEAGNAEIRILIGQLQIAGVVGGFGYAPGQPEFRGVGDLPADDQTVGLLEQASRRRAHDERGHQIFEHRSRPRNQRGAMRDRRRGAAEPEPMLRRDVALGDREEAGEPRLGSQEIVTVLIERAFVDEISDRQQLAVGVEQEAELHRQRHRPRRAFEDGQPFPPDVGRLGGLREIVAVRLDRTQDRARPEQHIRARPSPRSIASAPAMSTMISALARRPTSCAGQSSCESRACRKAERHRGERVVELVQGHGLGLAAVAQAGAFGAGDVERVGDAVEVAAPRRADGPSIPGTRWRARSDARPDCRCRRWTRISGRAGADRACRTNCRNGRGSVAGRPSSRASPPADRSPDRFRSSRNRAR